MHCFILSDSTFVSAATPTAVTAASGKMRRLMTDLHVQKTPEQSKGLGPRRRSTRVRAQHASAPQSPQLARVSSTADQRLRPRDCARVVCFFGVFANSSWS